MKSQIYNLIIVDKSGSMKTISRQAVTGINETLQTIRVAAMKDNEQEQFVSIVFFCGCGRQYVIDNKPIAECADIQFEQYRPCCMTPLYDAIGEACSRLRAATVDKPGASVSVTVITDGYENASCEYTHQRLLALINELKAAGWLFAYIGAEHDVEAVAHSLNIDNSMAFDKTEEGTSHMFACERTSRFRWMQRKKADFKSCINADGDLDEDEFLRRSRESNSDYFTHE